MNVIKLVIWDLDETFWHGTLSEEGISIIEENVDLLKRLTSRGIINSISSKNNYDDAKCKLSSLGAWDYFVFPKIGWYSKANAIKDTIETMGLRPVNVLFIDDNHLNLNEVQAVIPNINVMHPSEINSIEKTFNLKGKDDVNHTRLNHYKILEKKEKSRDYYDTDLDFLFSSEINVQLKHATIDSLERVHELIQRTNQLNFTKKRLEIEQVRDLLTCNKKQCYIVFVNDKFGDYGLVGFVSVYKEANELEHFCFSCRTLNLGVEQFVYDHFSYPKLKVVGDTAVNLKSNFKPNWINSKSNNIAKGKDIAIKSKHKLLLKGSCDLMQMMFYVIKPIDIIEETTFVTSDNLGIQAEHTYILLGKTKFNSNFPFLPVKAFNSVMFKESFDYVIYSVLLDYTQDLYINENDNITPFGGYSSNPFDGSSSTFNVKNLSSIDSRNMKEFYDKNKNIGPISPNDFYQNLNEILNNIDSKAKLILINGAEVEPYNNTEPGCVERHKVMNDVVDLFCKNNNNRVSLIDVRKHIKTGQQLGSTIRLYKRPIYKLLAEDLSSIIDIETKDGNARYLHYQNLFLTKDASSIIKLIINKVKDSCIYYAHKLLSIFKNTSSDKI